MQCCIHVSIKSRLSQQDFDFDYFFWHLYIALYLKNHRPSVVWYWSMNKSPRDWYQNMHDFNGYSKFVESLVYFHQVLILLLTYVLWYFKSKMPLFGQAWLVYTSVHDCRHSFRIGNKVFIWIILKCGENWKHGHFDFLGEELC